jgi:hypothetical protein
VLGSTRSAAIAAGLVAAFAVPSVASAAAPPNPHDPCSRAGRDTCGTLGVGFYQTYRYGVRWFGDYRGVVPGAAHAFCLDLGFWYASRSYRYRPRAHAVLRNRAGAPVPVERQREIAYAIWRYGRSAEPNRQAAVMLYVHSRVGDARAGEVDPAALNPAVARLYRRIARETRSHHGPYKIETRLPGRLSVGRTAAVSIRIVSAQGYPLPHVRISLAAGGTRGLPAHLETSRAGVAHFALTPTATSGLRLRVVTEPLASPRPRILVPTTAGAIANGQRLAVPKSRRVAATVVRTDVGASPQISTQVSAQVAAPGAHIADVVSVSGLGGSTVPVHVELWGPFASRGAIACTGVPYWQGSFLAHGDGTTTTTPVQLERAGYYTYRESIAERPPSTGFVTGCGEAAETTFVEAQPDLLTAASEWVVRPGSRISDRIRVQGLGSTPAAIEVELFGPFSSRAAITCSYRHLHWRGRINVAGEGTVRTPAVRVARAGFYRYRERLIGSPLVAGSTTSCAADAQTALVAPRIVTGRGDVAAYAAARGAGGPTPVRIRIPSLAIDAPVSPAAIDVAHGALGIPADIHRVGWWRDGMSPAANRGSILLAGHLDNARAGSGAFFRLGSVTADTLIEVATTSGRTYTYRVASVRTYRKNALPTSVYSRTGPARLVLVTCGGPFDAATGHYPDNIVVTAVPVR